MEEDEVGIYDGTVEVGVVDGDGGGLFGGVEPVAGRAVPGGGDIVGQGDLRGEREGERGEEDGACEVGARVVDFGHGALYWMLKS